MNAKLFIVSSLLIASSVATIPWGMGEVSNSTVGKRGSWNQGSWTGGGSCYDWSAKYCGNTVGSITYGTNLAKWHDNTALTSGSNPVVLGKNQQSPGATNLCWAFTAAATVESCFALKTKTKIAVSRQQIAEFGTNAGSAAAFNAAAYCPTGIWSWMNYQNAGGYNLCGDWATCGTGATTSGGWPQTAIAFSVAASGQVPKGVFFNEADYAYTCTSSCTPRTQPQTAKLNKLNTGIQAIVTGYSTSSSPSALRTELQSGPVAVCFTASTSGGSSLLTYTSGVWQPSAGDCPATGSTGFAKKSTHCMTATGYAQDSTGNTHYFLLNQVGTFGEFSQFMRWHENDPTSSSCNPDTGVGCGQCGIGAFFIRANCAPLLLNWDATGGGIYTTSKTGKAAVGFWSDDKWNTITQNYPSATYQSSPIYFSDSTDTTTSVGGSGVSLAVDTHSGSLWDNPNPTGQDPMFWRYIYSDFGTLTFKIGNLPLVSSWTVYLYGKAYDSYSCGGDQNTYFKVEVVDSGGSNVAGATNGANYVYSATSGSVRPWGTPSSPQPVSGVWVSGNHYSSVANVVVGANQFILITANAPNGCYGKPVTNGFQLLGKA